MGFGRNFTLSDLLPGARRRNLLRRLAQEIAKDLPKNCRVEAVAPDATQAAPDDATQAAPDDATLAAPDDATQAAPDDATQAAPDATADMPAAYDPDDNPDQWEEHFLRAFNRWQNYDPQMSPVQYRETSPGTLQGLRSRLS